MKNFHNNIKILLGILFILMPFIFIWANYNSIFGKTTEEPLPFEFNNYDVNDERETPYNSMWITNQYEKANKRNCVVLAATVPNFADNTLYIQEKGKPITNSVAWGYVFILPLSVRAWNQQNYHVITFIILDKLNINKNASKLLSIIHEKLIDEKATVVFVNVKAKHKMRVSQLVRLLPAGLNLFPDDVFITTSDADIWPARDPRYDIPSLNKIHITNHLCCGEFKINNTKYREYPMTSIAMTVKLWKKVFKSERYFPKPDRFIMELLYDDIQKYYKEDVYKPDVHGSFLWSVDQRYASILINDYNMSTGSDILSFYYKKGCRRLIPSTINSVNSSSCVGDVHTLKAFPWRYLEWPMMRTVRTIIFDKETVRQQDEYAQKFENAFDTMNRQPRRNV